MTRPAVVLRGDLDQPLRAECPHCGQDVDVTRYGLCWYAIEGHDDMTGRYCDGSHARVA